MIVDTAATVLPDALPIPARALASVTSTAEKSAMTQPPQQPPTQVIAHQRRSGCGTLLVALLVLAIITAIVVLLGAFGSSANDGSADTPAHRPLRWWRIGMTGNIWIDLQLGRN